MPSDNLILEHLRAICGTVENTAIELEHVRHRVNSLGQQSANIERQMAEMQAGIATVHLRLDQHGDRLARIERRLDIANGVESDSR